ELLQHGLEGQTGVVHEPELALVVADVVAEAERAVDDLLRAADREWGLRGELLQAGAVSIHGRLVEVWAELVHRVLRILAHERLPAEPDDGLRGRAVSVVLEPLAVEPDHLGGVASRPEDVVGEEAVTVVSRLLGDLGTTDAAVPDEGRRTVQGARRGLETLQRGAELAFPVDVVFAPQLAQQRVLFKRER